MRLFLKRSAVSHLANCFPLKVAVFISLTEIFISNFPIVHLKIKQHPEGKFYNTKI